MYTSESEQVSTNDQSTQGNEHIDSKGDEIAELLTNMKKVFPSGFSYERMSRSKQLGYRNAYHFQVTQATYVVSGFSSTPELRGPLRLSLHVASSIAKPPQITSAEGGLVPFHPQFQIRMQGRLKLGVWHDPRGNLQGEQIIDRIIRLIYTLAYQPECMNMLGSRPVNIAAQHFYLTNPAPLVLPEIQLEELVKLKMQPSLPNKLYANSVAKQEQVEECKSNGTAQKTKTLPCNLLDLTWPKNLDADIVLDQKNSEKLGKNGKFHLQAREYRIGLMLGLACKHEPEPKGWCDEIIKSERALEQLDAHSLQSALNEIIQQASNRITDERQSLGWYLVHAHHLDSRTFQMIYQIHRDNFPHACQFFLDCEPLNGQVKALRGPDLNVCVHQLLENDKLNPPKKSTLQKLKETVKTGK